MRKIEQKIYENSTVTEVLLNKYIKRRPHPSLPTPKDNIADYLKK